MNNSIMIAKREIHSLFNSPLAYIFITGFLVIANVLFFFVNAFFTIDQASMKSYFAFLPFILAILYPAITMRLWAEEKRQGTYEFIMTMPFTNWQIIIGKYIATMFIFFTTLILTVPIPVFISLLGNLDIGVIITEYLGIILMASAIASIGQAISAISKNQVSAFLFTILIIISLSILPQLYLWINIPKTVSGIINWLSPVYHFSGFSRGILDSRDIAWFIITSILGLYLTDRILVIKKWN